MIAFSQSVCTAFARLMSALLSSAASVSGLAARSEPTFPFLPTLSSTGAGCPLVFSRTENKKREPTERGRKYSAIKPLMNCLSFH